jgi:predicted alpha/beta-fold hydrolase
LPNFRKIKDFLTFDLMFTLPLNGFSSNLEYYRVSSSRHYLKTIQVPTLILHAKDDPLMHPGVVPKEQELADCVTLELSNHGGHLGFLMPAKRGVMPRSWLEERIPAHLAQFLTATEQPQALNPPSLIPLSH